MRNRLMNNRNSVCDHFSYWVIILCISFGSLFLLFANAEENPVPTDAQPINENSPKVSKPKPLALSYYIDNQSILDNIQFDSKVNQSKVETITDGELLILKHNAKSRIKRGNALFLHTNGESANHRRIVRPLAIQLSQLGWNIFIPNIAREDFTKPKFGNKRVIFETALKNANSVVKTSINTENPLEDKTQLNNSKSDDTNETPLDETKKSPASNNQYYFETTDAYQNYIIDICKIIESDPQWTQQPRILILNQTSSYWGLGCLADNIMPTIFLNPELPLGVKNNLEDIFSKQSSSFYVFHSRLTANTKMSSFSKALSSNQWRSENQRYSQGILPNGNMNIEDTRLAKRITGWAEKLKR